MSEPHRMRLRNGIRTVNGITGDTEPTYGEYVLASDYDALAARLAECERTFNDYWQGATSLTEYTRAMLRLFPIPARATDSATAAREG